MVPPNDKSDIDDRLWKNHVTHERVRELGEKIAAVYAKFDTDGFEAAVIDGGFDSLELKDRLQHIARTLQGFLPCRFKHAADILIKVAPKADGFANWSLTHYIEFFGLEHLDDSVRALKELTKHGTGEFAIRPFIIKYPDRMLPILHQWAQDKNEHVRRLAAEGTRPRGVWVEHITAFKKDPAPVLELLERLKDDPSLYVRKAVANNLNDISKDHPDTAIATGKKWLADGSEDTAWIVKRACRTLIKAGHPDVFPLFGFTDKPKIKVDAFKPSKKRVKIGDDFTITCRLTSQTKSPQRLAIDYRVHYVKANGKTNPKVFKGSERDLAGRGSVDLSFGHSFRPMTTRKHFPGKHKAELIINGQTVAAFDFDLTA
ncbi:MAG: DNA alkylation repair protein [candidate division Zixibacteria bacterium]|nr:DNA alkylation repair protein [candidate division Zixibacteria bacterium]